MRNPLPTFLFVLTFTISIGCSEECPETVAACQHTPPTDEACLAYFQRWFYNAGSNSCEQVGYSGCNAYGFGTEGECMECQCN